MRNIIIENKRKNYSKLKDKYPNSLIIDVTSKSELYSKFSPFYPHGNIPIPFSKGFFSESVEGIWQGLKIFENKGIDISKFEIVNMKGIKRTIKKNGKIKGHQKGIESNLVLNYNEAKESIYLPSYRWILENKLKEEIFWLKDMNKENDIVLLDYEVNTSIYNDKPLSHAYLIKLYLLDAYPQDFKI